MVKYNLGCGLERIDGYINCDIVNFPNADVVCPIWDLRCKEYKRVEPNSVDEIIASHVIEHVNGKLLRRTVEHWYSVLKPGGKLFIYCPNAKLIFQDYLDGTIDMVEASRLLFGEQDFENNCHRLCFDQQRLNSLIVDSGFCVVNELGRKDAYKYELGVSAFKK